jgi:Zn-dependent metalloprotease
MIFRTLKFPILAALLLLAVSLMPFATSASGPTATGDAQARLAQKSEGALHVDTAAATGVAHYVRAEGGVVTREFATAGSPEAIARNFLGAYGVLFGTDGANLVTQNIKTDSVGIAHVRFAQVRAGIPVFGADLIVHVGPDGAVRSANGYLVPSAEADSVSAAKLSANEAAGAALNLIGTKDAYADFAGTYVLNAGLITDKASDTHLTHRFRAGSKNSPELAQWVFVDAATGDVRFSYPAVTDGRNRSTYNMKTKTAYSTAVLARTETQGPVSSATSCTATDVNNAHDYAGHTYDFYKNRFNRDSYNNAGAALKSYVCYGKNYQNAFWDGSRMTYGKGFSAADDVVAHELSHAVTEYASGLVYSYQSGALNESFSDIFGEAVDLTNARGTDTAAVRWDMGEDIPGIGAIRDMMDPTRFSDPDWTGSTYYYCGTGDNGGVHYNSGVPNKAFGLMVDGGSFRGYTVSAIGIDQAVQVQYRTNEYYLTSSAKFRDNYNALNSSCADLYGAGSATCTAVNNAANAVGMNGSICGAP